MRSPLSRHWGWFGWPADILRSGGGIPDLKTKRETAAQALLKTDSAGGDRHFRGQFSGGTGSVAAAGADDCYARRRSRFGVGGGL